VYKIAISVAQLAKCIWLHVYSRTTVAPSYASLLSVLQLIERAGIKNRQTIETENP